MKNACLIVAGEQSGEEHALHFFDDLKNRYPGVDFWGVGGSALEEKGLRLLFHLKDFSTWGISEAVIKLPFYLRALRKIEEEARGTKTEVAILIDFQDFNLRLSRRLGKLGVRILYFAAPQAWAWRSYRASLLARHVHTLFTLIPFERKWFLKRGVSRAVSVPHPLYSRFKHLLPSAISRPSPPFRLLLLPGSRNFEVHLLLPEFIRAISFLRALGYDLKTALVCSPNVHQNLYGPYVGKIDEVVSADELGAVLSRADYALAASGTATLACALFCVPTVVAYGASLFSKFIFSTFFSYKGHISLANIVHEKNLFPELIQERATAYNMALSLRDWFDRPKAIEELKNELMKTRDLIGGDAFSMGDYIENLKEDME